MKTKEKLNEATATERLLDVIRGTGSPGAQQSSSQSSPEQNSYVKPVKENKAPFTRFTKTKTQAVSLTVGIDIGHEAVHLIKVARSNNKPVIVEHKSIPIPAELASDSGEFDKFLQSVVAPFCTTEKNTRIWTVMPSAQCEVRLVRIPKVSDKLLETTIFWTLKKEASFNEKDFFFDYEVRGESVDSGNKKLDVMCYIIPTAEVEGIKALFSRIKVPLSGISIVPFAVQNIFLNHWMPLSEKYTTCLFIGNSHSRIDLYNEGKLILTRTINTGINSMTDMLMETLNYRTKEGGKLTAEEARKILFALSDSSTTTIVLADGFTVAREGVERLIAPVLERFVRQMERTFEHFTLTLGGDRNIEKIYISSAIPTYEAMTAYFSAQLGAECRVFDPLKQELETSSFEERSSVIAAFGMALSDNAYTPNFIYTYKDKAKTAYAATVNRLILLGLIAAVIICSGIFGVQRYTVAQSEIELAGLEHQMKQLSPVVNKETLMQLTSTAGQKQQRYAEFSRRYRGMALIAEIAALTPDNVNLTSLRADFSEKPGSEKTKDPAIKTGNIANMDGVIRGRQDMLEMLLATYVMKLKASPMFSDVTVATSRIEPAKKEALLTFTLTIKVGSGK